MAFQFVNGTKILECNMSRNSFFQNIMLSYYRPIVKKEVELSNANANNSILCIGGGYFPCTAILFNQLSNATVTVIDNDLSAVEKSSKLIEKLGLSSKVIVKHTDGIDISSSNFDIIHIAMQVSPKEEVFNHIHSNAEQKAKILVRTPKQHLERGYNPFKEISMKHNNDVIQPKFSNIERTLLYVR